MYYNSWEADVTLESETLSKIIERNKELIQNNPQHMFVGVLMNDGKKVNIMASDLDCEGPIPTSKEEVVPCLVFLCGSEGAYDDLGLFDPDERTDPDEVDLGELEPFYKELLENEEAILEDLNKAEWILTGDDTEEGIRTKETFTWDKENGENHTEEEEDISDLY